jgi:signal transduction histidine kinase
MLLEEAGAFRVADSFGLAAPHRVNVRPGLGGLARALAEGPCVVRRSELHHTNGEALGVEQCWLVAPMRRGNGPLGMLLAACPDHEHHEQNRLYLQHMADETAVAVENAKLFRNVRELSVDEERRRLAHEMHDGVAQALTHVRLELEFMGRHGIVRDAPSKREINRLVRVVDRAIADVRSMIIGLRSSVSADGLAGSLRAYLRDLRGLGGPELTFVARGDVELPTEVEAEMFRIAQEAVSNATRHASANTVAVRLDQIEGRVRLAVDDDGSGFIMDAVRDGGVGLQAMRERATRIGARLTIQSVLGKGTSVEIVYSRQQASDKAVETGNERKIVLEGRTA